MYVHEKRAVWMTTEETQRVLAAYTRLRQSTDATALRQWGLADLCAQHAHLRVPYVALSRLRQYARCRGWALHYRQQGHRTEARGEAALAARHARYFRRLSPR